MKKLRVLSLFDIRENKPRGYDFKEEFRGDPAWLAENEVVWALKKLGHEVRMLGLFDDMRKLVEEVREFKPHVVFNLMEEFAKDAAMVPSVVAVLETLGVRYTGCSPLGLLLCKDKALAKAVLTQHGIPNPAFQIIRKGEAVGKPEKLSYPLVVKPNIEDASYGIAMASVVRSDAEFVERVRFLHKKAGKDALAEEYVAGRELYVSLLGTRRPKILPMREVKFGHMEEASGTPISTYRVKWDKSYRRKWGIKYYYVKDLSAPLVRRVEEVCRAAYRVLEVKGYGRVDLRLTQDGVPCVLEVNPNPNIDPNDEFAESARRGGIAWIPLIESVVADALSQRGQTVLSLSS